MTTVQAQPKRSRGPDPTKLPKKLRLTDPPDILKSCRCRPLTEDTLRMHQLQSPFTPEAHRAAVREPSDMSLESVSVASEHQFPRNSGKPAEKVAKPCTAPLDLLELSLETNPLVTTRHKSEILRLTQSLLDWLAENRDSPMVEMVDEAFAAMCEKMSQITNYPNKGTRVTARHESEVLRLTSSTVDWLVENGGSPMWDLVDETLTNMCERMDELAGYPKRAGKLSKFLEMSLPSNRNKELNSPVSSQGRSLSDPTSSHDIDVTKISTNLVEIKASDCESDVSSLDESGSDESCSDKSSFQRSRTGLMLDLMTELVFEKSEPNQSVSRDLVGLSRCRTGLTNDEFNERTEFLKEMKQIIPVEERTAIIGVLLKLLHKRIQDRFPVNHDYSDLMLSDLDLDESQSQHSSEENEHTSSSSNSVDSDENKTKSANDEPLEVTELRLNLEGLKLNPVSSLDDQSEADETELEGTQNRSTSSDQTSRSPRSVDHLGRSSDSTACCGTCSACAAPPDSATAQAGSTCSKVAEDGSTWSNMPTTQPDPDVFKTNERYRLSTTEMQYRTVSSNGLGIEIEKEYKSTLVLSNRFGDRARFNELENRYGRKILTKVMQKMREMTSHWEEDEDNSLHPRAERDCFNAVMREEVHLLGQQMGHKHEPLTDRRLDVLYQIQCGFNKGGGHWNRELDDILLTYARIRLGIILVNGSELQAAVVAVQRYYLVNISGDTLVGHGTWTLPIVMMLNQHMRLRGLTPIAFSNIQEDDEAAKTNERDHHSRAIWVNGGLTLHGHTNKPTRIKVEARDIVINELLDYGEEVHRMRIGTAVEMQAEPIDFDSDEEELARKRARLTFD